MSACEGKNKSDTEPRVIFTTVAEVENFVDTNEMFSKAEDDDLFYLATKPSRAMKRDNIFTRLIVEMICEVYEKHFKRSIIGGFSGVGDAGWVGVDRGVLDAARAGKTRKGDNIFISLPLLPEI